MHFSLIFEVFSASKVTILIRKICIFKNESSSKKHQILWNIQFYSSPVTFPKDFWKSSKTFIYDLFIYSECMRLCLNREEVSTLKNYLQYIITGNLFLLAVLLDTFRNYNLFHQFDEKQIVVVFNLFSFL